MPENKTKPTDISVSEFLNSVTDPAVKKDCRELAAMMESIAGSPPVMWGSSIIGFGSYHYKYESGREGDMPYIAFSPRKQNITLYFRGYLEQYLDDLQGLGKHKTGKGCLYIKTLKDINTSVLRRMIVRSCEGL